MRGKHKNPQSSSQKLLIRLISLCWSSTYDQPQRMPVIQRIEVKTKSPGLFADLSVISRSPGPELKELLMLAGLASRALPNCDYLGITSQRAQWRAS
jgi:hypothetical protein